MAQAATATLAYGGHDSYASMAAADNYNAFLHGLVAAAIGEAHRVLDVGAADGRFALPLLRQGREVHCVEIDPAFCRALAQAGLPVSPDLATLPDGSFEAAYALNVLEHVADDAGMLAQLHAKLRPGGRLLIYVPAFQLLYSPLDLAVGHLRRYRRRDLEPLLHRAGFAVERLRYVDSLGFAAALAYRLLNRDGRLDPRAILLYDRILFPVSRILDPVAGRLFGKNLIAVARRR
ncbi:MAG: class I SAM-dependent methyltransferase [Dongiaceae bacterium]